VAVSGYDVACNPGNGFARTCAKRSTCQRVMAPVGKSQQSHQTL
jgi:hypothetical protein